MSQALSVVRTEKKYLLPIQTAGEIQARLSYILKPDANCKNGHPYAVTSLYFDSIYDGDYFEKISGLECRKKIRLRTYGDDVVKLECKQKQGSKQSKQSMLVSKAEAEAIIKGDLQCLLDDGTDLARQFYVTMKEGVYRPKSLIRYQRFAYTVPTNEIRITFDRQMEAHEGDFRLFDPSVAYYPIQPSGKVVLEIKYNGFLLDYIQSALAPFGLTETANSKYVCGRKFGMGVNIL